MAKVLKVEFPQGKIYVSKGGQGKAYIEYNKSYVNKFNNNLNKTQVYLDNKVVNELQKYVSYDSGTQAKSIRLATNVGSGIVTIGVPYARFQAEGKVMVGINSRKAWANRGERKVVINKDLQYQFGGIRGAHPFERMKADKRESILKQVAAYSRRINGQ